MALNRKHNNELDVIDNCSYSEETSTSAGYKMHQTTTTEIFRVFLEQMINPSMNIYEIELSFYILSLLSNTAKRGGKIVAHKNLPSKYILVN